MAEEALLGALEGGTRGGLGLRVERTSLAGDVRCPHGRIKVVVDDRERNRRRRRRCGSVPE